MSCRFRLTRAICLALILFPLAAEDDTEPFADYSDIEGEGITVVARAQTEQTRILEREELASFRAANLSDLLEKAAALSAVNYGGYGTVSSVSLRGFSGKQVRVEVNGVPVNSPQSGDFDFTSINVESIERIEIDYGKSPGGTIKIFTAANRAGDPDRKSLSIGFSNTSQTATDSAALVDTQRVQLESTITRSPFSLRTGAFATSAANRFGYRTSAGTPVIREGNDIRDAGGNLDLSVALPSLARVSLSSSLYAADKDVAGSEASLSSGTQNDRRTLTTIAVDLPRAGSDLLGAKAGITHAWTALAWKDASTFSNHDLHSILAHTAWNLSGKAPVSLDFTGSLRYDRLDSTNTGTVDRHEAMVSASVRHAKGRKTAVEASLAAALSSRHPAVLLPSVSFSTLAGDTAIVQASIFRAWKSPDFNDLYWNADLTAAGNPGLSGEESWTVSARCTIENGSDWEVEQSAFASWYFNAIQWQNSSGIWRPENVGEALYAGGETRIAWKPEKGPGVTVTYNFIETRVLTGDLTFADNKQMPYQARHRLNIGIRGTLPRTVWYISSRYEGERYTGVLNVSTLPSFHVLDAGIAFDTGSSLVLSLDGKNLLGERYTLRDGYPMPLASITLGARYTID